MSEYRIRAYDPITGTPTGDSRAGELASERYPNQTRHAAAQRRAFIHGYVAALKDYEVDLRTAYELTS